MDILAGLTGLVIGAVVAWQIAQGCAAAEMSRLRARQEERIGYWQGETERANARASQLAEQTAAWTAGCQQGREDVLSLARVFVQHAARSDDEGPAAG